MAVINDPSTGNDVINDTTGNDVINLSGGDDAVHLSGGNDVINTHRNAFYAHADFQQPHVQSLEINGSGLFANVGHAQLAAADFDKLITAMASLTPPSMGQLDLNATQNQKLDAVIAANWH